MENYCRLCAEIKVNLSNLNKINSELLEWFGIIVNIEQDGLPQNICYTCLCNIEEFGFFLDKCKNSYEILQKLAVKQNSERFNNDTTFQNYSDDYIEEKPFSNTNFQIISNPWVDYGEESEINSIKNSDESRSVKAEQFEIEQLDVESNLENYDEKFECVYCHTSFSSRAEKNEHIKEHNFFCTECGLNFPTRTKFNYHIANHKNKREFRCKYCPKAFNHRSDLTNHLKFSHAGGERPRRYRCELCEKNYCTPTELKIHLRFHRNERPFKCHLCDHSYVIKCHLQQHLKKHANIKDKICTEPGCGKAYRDMSSLKKHMDMHLPDDNKKYSCDVCSRKFSFFYILSDHRRKSHRKIALLQPLKKDEIQV